MGAEGTALAADNRALWVSLNAGANHTSNYKRLFAWICNLDLKGVTNVATLAMQFHAVVFETAAQCDQALTIVQRAQYKDKDGNEKKVQVKKFAVPEKKKETKNTLILQGAFLTRQRM